MILYLWYDREWKLLFFDDLIDYILLKLFSPAPNNSVSPCSGPSAIELNETQCVNPWEPLPPAPGPPVEAVPGNDGVMVPRLSKTVWTCQCQLRKNKTLKNNPFQAPLEALSTVCAAALWKHICMEIQELE